MGEYEKYMARQWSGEQMHCSKHSATRHDLGEATLDRPVKQWPTCGPSFCVMYTPGVLRTSKCLLRNQELWAPHKLT